MAQAGIKLDYVKTEDGLMATFKKIADMKLTVNGAPVIPLAIHGKDYQAYTLPILTNMFGGMQIDKDGNYRDLIFAPEYKHALEFLNKVIRNNYLDPNQFTQDQKAIDSLVMAGRVFCFLGGTAGTSFQQQENWDSPGPILSNNGEKPVLAKDSTVARGWMQTFISKTTKAPDRAAKWLSFMSSDEGMRLAYYGFKDIDYTINEKGLIVQTPQGKKDADDFSKTGVFAYWPFHYISWHDSVTQAPTDVKTGPDGVVAMQVQCAFGKAKETVRFDTAPLRMPSNYIPKGSDLDNIKTQVDQYKTAQISKTIMAKDDASFNKEYDTLISQIKDLGLTKYDSKINEQVQKNYKEYGVSLKAVN